MKGIYLNRMKPVFLRVAAIVCCLGLMCQVSAQNNQNSKAKTISGTVRDEAGTPLVGVIVYAKGTTAATSTDAKGKFALQVDWNSTVVFSYIGMKTQEIPAERITNRTITMVSDATDIDDVLVVG